MCGAIVVDVGRSRSTNLGHDAYIMIIAWISSWLFEVLSIAQQWLFSHRLLFFSREATSETYGPRFSFHHICLWDLFSLAFIFKYIKPKIPCCNLFVPRFIYPIYHFLPHIFAYLQVPYPEGIDNPFNMSGCDYLLFVCRCCLRGVRRFSYWSDNLGLTTEGNTYHRYTSSSLPLWGNTDVVLADIKKNFWCHCRGRSSTSTRFLITNLISSQFTLFVICL